MTQNENTVDIEIEFINGKSMTARVDKRDSQELSNTTAQYVRLWSVDDKAWCHINRDHIVCVIEPREDA
jgi:hypothetical protein